LEQSECFENPSGIPWNLLLKLPPLKQDQEMGWRPNGSFWKHTLGLRAWRVILGWRLFISGLPDEEKAALPSG
jgi:hypothetical protein